MKGDLKLCGNTVLWGSKVLLTVREGHVYGRLRIVCKSIGPAELHPRISRELADVIAKHSPSYLRNHGSQVKFLVAGKGETFYPSLKRLERRTL